MGAIGALVLADADRLARTASVIAAMSVEALLGTDAAFAAAYQLARPHPGRSPWPPSCVTSSATAACRRATTATPTRSRTRIRCAASRRSARSATRSTTCGVSSTSSSTRRPTTHSSSRAVAWPTPARSRPAAAVISGGNFHGEPIAFALDFTTIAVAELGSISERRTALLVDPRLNGGLPPFLAASSGIDSGMMIHQYTAAALVSENKVLAHPASVDSIPTSANQEDHVSMGAISARHARTVVGHVERILAIELVVAAQAPRAPPGGFRRRRTRGGRRRSLARARARVRHLDGDREPGPDLHAATRARPRRQPRGPGWLTAR